MCSQTQHPPPPGDYDNLLTSSMYLHCTHSSEQLSSAFTYQLYSYPSSASFHQILTYGGYSRPLISSIMVASISHNSPTNFSYIIFSLLPLTFMAATLSLLPYVQAFMVGISNKPPHMALQLLIQASNSHLYTAGSLPFS